MTKLKILISVLNWNNYGDTINCILQLNGLKQEIEKILVIDNHSGNDSVRKIKLAFPGIEIIESPVNKGFAAGHKIAADHAIKNNFELLWILNPDVILSENTFPALVEAYRRRGSAIYGSVSVKEDKPDTIEFAGAYEIGAKNKSENIPPSPTRRGRAGDRVPEEEILPLSLSQSYHVHKDDSLSSLQKEYSEFEVGAVEGFSMLVPVEVIKKHGFMDTRFFMYGEETEYCLGLSEKGIPSLIVPNSVIVHKGEGSFQKSVGAAKIITYYRARNYRLIAKKHFGLTNNKILKSVGGIMGLTGFFIKWIFAGRKFRGENTLDYFHNLGILHALFGVKGKRISPEKYL